MENVEETSMSVENKWISGWSIKKMSFYLIGPLNSYINHLPRLVYQGVDFGVD
jgi:hypothetical protein